jgi:hypothetical protein
MPRLGYCEVTYLMAVMAMMAMMAMMAISS